MVGLAAKGERPALAAIRIDYPNLRFRRGGVVFILIANDEGYENVFSERLRAHADPGDVLLVISSSGNSPNVLEALRTARELEMRTIAWVGFGGGAALELSECCVHVEVDDYGMAEGIHGVIGHLVTDLVVQGVRGAQRPSYVPSAPRIAVGLK